MDFVTGLRCRECARAYPAEALHVCDYCFGPLEVAYDYEALRGAVSREVIAAGPQTIWRYAPLLPVSDPAPIDLGTDGGIRGSIVCQSKLVWNAHC